MRLAYSESNLKTIDLANVSFDEKMERATVALPESLAQGSEIQLIIKHSRDLTDELMGLYYPIWTAHLSLLTRVIDKVTITRHTKMKERKGVTL